MEVGRQELTDELGRTARALRSGSRSNSRVHDIRKRLKHCRAILRLLRKSLGEEAYRLENAHLRDAARPLVPVRDAAVLVQALDDLCPRPMRRATFCGALRKALQQESRERQEQLHRKALLPSAHIVRDVERRMRMLPEAQLAHADPAKAVKRAYRSSRRAMTVAEEERSRDHLHEWRKQVKYFASQLKSLAPVMRKGLNKTYKKSHRLTDHLGDDHDLAMLHDKIIQHRRLGATDREVRTLLHQLAQRRAELQRKAYRSGKRLFAITAGRMEARVRHRLRR
jgi:CHAD domain-containing protein